MFEKDFLAILRLERKRAPPAPPLGEVVQGPRWRGPNAPRGCEPTPPAGGPVRGGAGYARRRRHTLAPVRKAFSTVWLPGRAGRRVGSSRPPRSRPPPLAGPARRTAAGPRPGRLGWARAGPYRPN